MVKKNYEYTRVYCTICEAMNNEPIYKTTLRKVHKLLRLYKTVPISSVSSERTFSAL